MTSLSGSAFLQALGWAIAGSLWQMALLWTIYQLCFGVWRNIRASVKTGAATLLQFVGFGWFLTSLVGHYWKIKVMPHTVSSYASAYEIPVQEHHPLFYVNRILAWSEHYLPYLSGAYLLVLAFLLVRVVKAYRHVQEVRTEGLSKIDPKWRVYVQQLAHRIGIHRDIRIWLSEKIDIPATMGYLKPLILLPIASFNHLSTEQVEAIILHELAHIKRNDYLLNLILTVMDTVLFFNPFAQLIAKHIRTERENSCDDFVLQFRYNPHVYASALLSLEQQRLSPELAMAATGKTDLLDRIKRIMNVPAKPMNYGQKLMALLITAGILASLAWLTPENIEHKPILNSMAALLPVPPVPDAPAPPTTVAVKASNKVHAPHPCIVVKDDVTLTSDGDDWHEDPSQDVAIDESQPTGRSVWTSKAGLLFSSTPMVFKLAEQNAIMKSKVLFRMDSSTLGLRTLKICIDSNEARLMALNEQMKRKALQDDHDVYLLDRNAQVQQLEIEKALRFREQQLQEQQLHEQQLLELQRKNLEDERQQKQRAIQVLRDINLKLLNIERTSASYAYASKMKIGKAKVLDQQQEEEETGISADQPGWQAPTQPFISTADRSRFKAISVGYRVMDFQAKTTTVSPYRERYTLYTPAVAPAKHVKIKGVAACPAPAVPSTTNVVYTASAYEAAPMSQASEASVAAAASEDEQARQAIVRPRTPRKAYQRTAQSPLVTNLVNRLESDGYLAERGTVRIVVENNTLTINGQQQPDAVYSRYKECLDGKALVILSTGKVIQITVH
jgi:Zn-dependent protease with chaperone function